MKISFWFCVHILWFIFFCVLNSYNTEFISQHRIHLILHPTAYILQRSMKQLIKRKKSTHEPLSPSCFAIIPTQPRNSILSTDDYTSNSILQTDYQGSIQQVSEASRVLKNVETVAPASGDLFLNKDSILKGLEDGIFVQQKAPDDWTSDVWKSFNLVYSLTHGVTNYCICRHCGRIYSYKSKGKLTGTRNLKDHLNSSTGCKKQFTEKQTFSNQYSIREPVKDKNNLITEACIRLCVEDFLPFELIEGTGFQEFIKHLIKLGHSGTASTLEDANGLSSVPYPMAVFQNVHRIYNGIIFEISKLLHKRIQVPDALFATAISVEIWKDDFVKDSYFSASLHYIDERWNYINRCISFSLFDFRDTEVNQFLKENFVSILQDRYRVDLSSSPLRFTLEKDCDLSAPFLGVHCASHILHSVLMHTFDEEESVLHPRVLNFILLAKRVIKKTKEWGEQTYLPASLKKCSQIRWNAVYYVLKFIQHSSDELYSLFEMHGDEEELKLFDAVRPDIEDFMLLNTLIEILKCFKDMMKILQVAHEPTLHLVWFVKYELIKNVKLMTCQDGIQMCMKSFNDRLLLNLETHFVFNKIHQIARFLHPLSKSLKGLACEERSSVLEELKAYMQVVESHSSFLGISSTSQQTMKCLEMIDTCDQQVLDLPSIHFSQRTAGTLSIEDELSLYEAYQLQVYDMSTYLRESHKDSLPLSSSPPSPPLPPYILFDCLKWWMNNQYMFPRLAIVARFLLSTPASSVSLDKTPNEVILTLEKHACLSRPLESMILCHQNSDLFNRYLTTPLAVAPEKMEF